jgi:hypothetical protein
MRWEAYQFSPSIGVFEIEIQKRTGCPTGWYRRLDDQMSGGVRTEWNFITGESRTSTSSEAPPHGGTHAERNA